MIDDSSPSSTRPYLIRALYEWCTDNGLTPYVAVRVDERMRCSDAEPGMQFLFET